MRLTRDLISGGTLLGLSILYYSGTRSLPSTRDTPGPAFFPILLSVALALLALVIIAQGLRKHPTEQASARLFKPLAAMVLTTLYAITFEPVGFLPTTFMYTLLLTLSFGLKRWRVALVIPFISTAFVYLLFELALGVRLPMGLLS